MQRAAEKFGATAMPAEVLAHNPLCAARARGSSQAPCSLDDGAHGSEEAESKNSGCIAQVDTNPVAHAVARLCWRLCVHFNERRCCGMRSK